MKRKFEPGDVVEFSRVDPRYYAGRTEQYGVGPFIVLGFSWGGFGVIVAKLEDGLRFGSFHEDNLERNEFLTAVHKAQKHKPKRKGVTVTI
jgi:hypothetical protein